jgi:hypothetical protein
MIEEEETKDRCRGPGKAHMDLREMSKETVKVEKILKVNIKVKKILRLRRRSGFKDDF